MRQLIVNADDYGISPAVCHGILEASRGVVSSTTVMANLVRAADLEQLCESQLPAGIHLNLSAGRPVSGGYPQGLLLPDGTFNKALALDPVTWANSGYCAAAAAEWRAQTQALSQAGLSPTHVDSHHHVHLLDGLFEPALRLAASLGIGIRTRGPQAPLARQHSCKTPQHLVEGFFGKQSLTAGNLLALLADAEPYAAVELVCHPGVVDGPLEAISGYTVERQLELSILRSESLRLELKRAGWELCGYDAL